MTPPPSKQKMDHFKRCCCKLEFLRAFPRIYDSDGSLAHITHPSNPLCHAHFFQSPKCHNDVKPAVRTWKQQKLEQQENGWWDLSSLIGTRSPSVHAVCRLLRASSPLLRLIPEALAFLMEHRSAAAAATGVSTPHQHSWLSSSRLFFLP